MIDILKDAGYFLERTGKHDKWSNGEKSVFIPNNHKGFSRVLAERLLSEIGLL